MTAFGFEMQPVSAPEVDRDLLQDELGDSPELFDPGEAPPARDEGDAPDVSDAQVRALLASLGGLTSFAIGNREIDGHWRFTADELDDLTPPLTRMVNASPRLKAIVARSDALSLAIVLSRYGLRNLDEQRKWKREHTDDDERTGEPLQPAAGGAAVPGEGGAAAGRTGPAAGVAGAGVHDWTVSR